MNSAMEEMPVIWTRVKQEVAVSTLKDLYPTEWRAKVEALVRGEIVTHVSDYRLGKPTISGPYQIERCLKRTVHVKGNQGSYKVGREKVHSWSAKFNAQFSIYHYVRHMGLLDGISKDFQLPQPPPEHADHPCVLAFRDEFCKRLTDYISSYRNATVTVVEGFTARLTT
jgi:hypothetical protein